MLVITCNNSRFLLIATHLKSSEFEKRVRLEELKKDLIADTNVRLEELKKDLDANTNIRLEELKKDLDANTNILTVERREIDERFFQCARLNQVMELVNYIEECDIFAIFDVEKFSQIPMVIVGDFNEEPDKAAMKYLKSLNFTNAYYDNMQHPELYYTTFKKRTNRVKHHAIDHIVHSKHFRTCGLKPIPQPTEYLPNETYPSDHVHITARLCML
jgi:hypothetical protein